MVEKSRAILTRCSKIARREKERSVGGSHMFSPPLSPTKAASRVGHSSSTLRGQRALEGTRREFLSRPPRRLPQPANLLALIERTPWHRISREFHGFRLPEIPWNLYIVRLSHMVDCCHEFPGIESRDVESPHNCFYLLMKLHDSLIVHVQPALRWIWLLIYERRSFD